ncbi:murein hydrolase activator EnvC [Streptomyces sp. JJ36]|uniref:murein hydrolase activator EnvC family protein n=1 Tax=Streptomyces sp. JJ36 TaxID=2736645 RepID=UPI00279619BD|nr:M23 family metallopeptidase [Streptomyces sp. JJ36]MCF6523269.1 M23 family metallopeptidase [Streptomyces sp. JJ36]
MRSISATTATTTAPHRSVRPRRPGRRPPLVPALLLLALTAMVLGAVPAAADRASPGVGPGGGPGRSWPVSGAGGAPRPLVLRLWDPPATPWAAGHRGVDLATLPGRPVRAVAAGRVSFAGRVAGRGVVTVALAGSGTPSLRTTYEPVRPAVREGARVRAGEVVGTVQAGPYHCERACLHWGLLRGEAYRNPLGLLPPDMLRGGGARLLPYAEEPVPPASAPVGAGELQERHPGGVAAAALAAASLWAHRRLRRHPARSRPAGPGGRGVRTASGRRLRLSRTPRAGPWRRQPG